ncbi:MAG: hypothetical protein ACT4P5_23065 [Armatimonadota bacterium]
MSSSVARTIAPAVLAALLGLSLSAQAGESHPHASAAPASSKAAETKDALRDLWVGHVFWVRNVAVQTLAGNTAAATAAENGVVANAKQIAGAIEPFYGKAASDKLFGLLAGHYGAIKDYLVAKDKAGQDAAWKRVGANAEEIAVFLSSANPNLPVDTLRSLLLAHGGHHVQQINQLRAKDYAGEAQTWEAMKNHMYTIADALAGAIAKQFPKKFA